MNEIKVLISDIVESAGYVVEDIKMSETGGTLKVIVDSENGIDSGALVKLSRSILNNETYDTKYAETFRLEVSSPGIDAPLTQVRHFKKNMGREIDLKHSQDGVANPLRGRITAVDNDSVEIELENKKEIKSVKVTMDKIESGMLRLKW